MWRHSSTRRLSAEMEAHLDELTATHLARGLSPEDARAAARREFGNVARVRERYQEQRGWLWFDELRQDVRYALRTWRRDPGFAILAVVTLALGIGAATAIFSVVNAAMLRPLPYVNGERLVRVRAEVRDADGVPRAIPVSLNESERQQLAARARSLEHVGSAVLQIMNWRGHDPRWQGARISASAFSMLDVQPLLGRVLTPDDEAAGVNALVLSEQSWRRDFGARGDVLGQTVTLETVLGRPGRSVFTIVGVMPAAFEYPSPRALFWMSIAQPGPSAAAPRTPTIATLAPGVSVEAAAADISPVLQQIAAARPAPPNGAPSVVRYEIVREHAERIRLIRPVLLALGGAVLIVLLIAAINVAGLTLTRAAARQRELAVRMAIGAGRLRLVRLAITESLLLAALASAVGAVVAAAGLRLLQVLTDAPYRVDLDIDGRNTFPGLETVALDTSVLWISAAIAAVIGVALAAVASLYFMRIAPAVSLRGGSGSTTFAASSRPGRWRRGRSALVVAQVAMAVVLLVAGGLLMTSFRRLMTVDTGFSPDDVLTFQVSLSAERYPTPAAVRNYAEELTQRLSSLAGVQVAGYANQLPLVALRDTAGGLWRTPDPSRRGAPPDAADARIVSHEFLRAMGVRLVAGRGLTAGDDEAADRVLLINEALARRDFNGRAAIGQSVYVGADPAPWQIVGIVADVRQMWVSEPAEPQFFIDARQASARAPLFPVGPYYAVRAVGDQMVVRAAVTRTIAALDPEAVIFNVAPMTDVTAVTVGRPRLYAVLLDLFAAVGLTLAVVGVFGVTTSSVVQRTREIGVRMALGARRREVLSMIMRSAMLMVVAGLMAGLGAAALLTRFLETMLFDVQPLDGWVFALAAAGIAIVSALAALLPARRATRVDPLLALRAE